MTPAIDAPRERLVSIFDVDACAFCGEVGVMHKCSWKAEKNVKIPATELAVGDRMRVGPDEYRRVLTIMRSYDAKTIFCWLQGLQTPRTFTLVDVKFSANGPSVPFPPTVVGLRTVPCSAACCDNCAIERADHVHICRDHWMDWSRIS